MSHEIGDFAREDFAKDGGEELFTKMQCVLSRTFHRIVKDSLFERYVSW